MALGVTMFRNLPENELTRLPVPSWDDLPVHAQRDLRMGGFDDNWLSNRKLPPNVPPEKLWLTLFVVYVKMKGLGLWHFVQGEKWLPENRKTELGKLHFWCPDHRKLKALLSSRSDFTTPDASDTAWLSREKRCEGSLHFKRFDENDFAGKVRIQAHIDRFGTGPEVNDWSSLQSTVGCSIAHLATYNGYKNVDALRVLLLRQGWDTATLLGKSAMNFVSR